MHDWEVVNIRHSNIWVTSFQSSAMSLSLHNNLLVTHLNTALNAYLVFKKKKKKIAHTYKQTCKIFIREVSKKWIFM